MSENDVTYIADVFHIADVIFIAMADESENRKDVNMDRSLNFVEELSFVRVGGTEDERRAAGIILREINLAGEKLGRTDATGELMSFTIPYGVASKWAVKAQDKELYSRPYLRSGTIDTELKLLYLEQGSEIDFANVGDLGDTAVLLNELREAEVYKRLIEHKAAAFLIFKGKYYNTDYEASLYSQPLREQFTKNGAIPGFTITAADANRLIKKDVKTVHLTLKQENTEETSQNVLATIKGTDLPEESIVLTAHYDSVPLGTGSWDNATGATVLLAIYRHFIANPPRRTMRFIWCGSEELGLLGSKAYIAQHEGLLESIKFAFNFDMCGTALGNNDIFITGNKELATYVEQFCRAAGYSARTMNHVQSSDSAPFCDRGIPALGLSRGTMSAAEIHSVRDVTATLSESALQKNLEFAVKIIGAFVNAALIPIKREISDETKKELDKYFSREIKKVV
ncbi:MAG: M28 family peptidase [Clostridiales bacterium]|nr:M28 family peptidase [Clostridiales bacterium]